MLRGLRLLRGLALGPAEAQQTIAALCKGKGKKKQV